MTNKVLYLVTASKAIQDSSNGLFTAIEVFDGFFIPKNSPSIIKSFVVVGKAEAENKGKLNTTITLIGPDGSSIADSKLSGELNPGFFQFSAHFDLITFTQIGKYTFKVSFNGIEDTSIGDRFNFLVVKEQ